MGLEGFEFEFMIQLNPAEFNLRRRGLLQVSQVEALP